MAKLYHWMAKLYQWVAILYQFKDVITKVISLDGKVISLVDNVILYHSKTLYQKLYHWLTKLYHSETLYQSFIYKVTLTSIPTCSITCMFYIPGSKCALLMHIYTASVAISDSPTASVSFSDSPTASVAFSDSPIFFYTQVISFEDGISKFISLVVKVISFRDVISKLSIIIGQDGIEELYELNLREVLAEVYF